MSESTYVVRHRTEYKYEDLALQSHNLACLFPRTCPGQTVEHAVVQLDPNPDWRQSWQDVYGNPRESFCLSAPHNALNVTLLARIRRSSPVLPESSLTWEQAVLPSGSAWVGTDPLQREFAFPSPLLPALEAPGLEADDCFPPGRPVLEALDAFMQRIHETFTYEPGATSTFTPLDVVLENKAGVCQDFAHAAIAELRRRGFAVGYVSGYLETQPPPGREKLRGADATHAWYAVFLPTVGWVHFDPTNNTRVGERHLITAWGRDYADVAPLKGVLLGGGEHEIKVEVDVWSWPDQVPEDVMAAF
jgi:transglutaminase-like putative cysteine protease